MQNKLNKLTIESIDVEYITASGFAFESTTFPFDGTGIVHGELIINDNYMQITTRIMKDEMQLVKQLQDKILERILKTGEASVKE